MNLARNTCNDDDGYLQTDNLDQLVDVTLQQHIPSTHYHESLAPHITHHGRTRLACIPRHGTAELSLASLTQRACCVRNKFTAIPTPHSKVLTTKNVNLHAQQPSLEQGARMHKHRASNRQAHNSHDNNWSNRSMKERVVPGNS
jgi:hypothetical protein